MKFQRQAKILELIEHNEIETQEELSMRLRDLGYDTTQATVSRDIRELKLIKSMTSKGNYRYEQGAKPSSMPLKFTSALTDTIIRI